MRFILSFHLKIVLAIGMLLGCLPGWAAGYKINTGDILIANYNGASVVKLDVATGNAQQLGGAFTVPTDLVLDPSGNLFISEWTGAVKKLQLSTGAVSTVMPAGSGPSQVWGITQGSAGDLFVTSRGNDAVYRVDPTTGAATLISQGGNLSTPVGIDILDDTHLVVACLLASRLVSVSIADGSQSVIAEGGVLDQPWGVAVQGTDIYIAGYDRKDIQHVTPAGVVTTIATVSDFPYGMGLDPAGNPTIGVKGISEAVVKVSPSGTTLRNYTGPLIRWVTGVEVSGVTIAAPNTAPTLDLITDQTVEANSTLSFTVGATDPDVPPQTLSFSLEPGAPIGAAISPSGLFSWTPTEAQANAVYPITVTVTDDGSPLLSDSAPFNVTVSPPNQPPVPPTPVLERAASWGAKLPVTAFLGTDPDGDPVTLVSAGPDTGQGGSVAVVGDWVAYLPPVGWTGADTFTFQLSDGRGGTAQGTATVNVRVDQGVSFNIRTEPGSGTSVWVHGNGVPGRPYAVQYTESVDTPAWITIATAVADNTGHFAHLDTPPDGAPARTYRAIEP